MASDLADDNLRRALYDDQKFKWAQLEVVRNSFDNCKAVWLIIFFKSQQYQSIFTQFFLLSLCLSCLLILFLFSSSNITFHLLNDE